jgi:hypothetical protein
MQVVVQPNTVGPFTFGISTRVGSERTGAPGAFSITSLEPRSPEDGAQISEISRDVATQMMGLEGFMGWVGVTVGNRMLTVTAWAKPEDSKQLMRLAPHQKGARGFFGNELSAGGWVSVWTPERIGTLWTRCGVCGAMLDSGAASGTCECGATVPEPRAYW